MTSVICKDRSGWYTKCFLRRVMQAAMKLRATVHACTKYAQVVLGLSVNDRDLVANPKLHGRCSRGIERLVERAQPAPESFADPGRSLLVVGTRALVVQEGEGMT